MLKNTDNSYGLITKIFHWLIALAVLGLITVGFTMASMNPSAEKSELYTMHRASGTIILILVVLRLAWKFSNKAVKPPKNLPNILKIVAKSGHFLLYIFMLSMPISGILMTHFSGIDIPVFGMFMIPAALDKMPEIAYLFHKVHVLGVFAFITIIILHTGAALYHHFVRRDNVFMRMIK